MNRELPTVMITVKPRHLGDMRQGVKGYELRKTRPGIQPPFRVVCCESGSGGAVTAEFICPACPELGCTDAVIATLAHITEQEAHDYRMRGTRRLYGWKVTDFIDYKASGRVKHVADYGLNRPPQSWCYVREVPEA